MRKLLLIFIFLPFIGLSQNISSKTTIKNDTIIEYCKYHQNGAYDKITYRYLPARTDTIFVRYDSSGDTAYSSDCMLEKIYNENNQISLKYWSCVDGGPGDYDLWSEDAVEFVYDEIGRLIEKRECLGEADREYDNCYDDMIVTYYQYRYEENSLSEKIVVTRENRGESWRDTVFKKIETLESRSRYDYDAAGNNIMIITFNADAEVTSKDMMTYKDNLLMKKESFDEDTVTIEYEYNDQGDIILIIESMEMFGNLYSSSQEYNDRGQLLFTSDYGPGEDYECYYEYNQNGNLIYEKCYDISGEHLNHCVVSIYSYNSFDHLTNRIDIYIDEYKLYEIGDNSVDAMNVIDASDINDLRKMSYKLIKTNIEYEY